MTRVAIVGPGAIGGMVAAWLCQSETNEVVVCARTPFERLQVETPGGPVAASPRVFTDPADVTPVEWVLVATKTYDAAGASLWLPGLTGASTRVAVLQNGVEHVEHFSACLPLERIVPVIVDIPAERHSPGVIHQRRYGSLSVQDDEAGAAFAKLFSETPIEVALTNDMKTAGWKKLCQNSAGVVSAILLKPTGVARGDGIAELLRGLVLETIAVARAEGAVLEDSLADAVVQGCREAPPDGINSIFADRAAGRPTEIDARNGVIVRLGKLHGIRTPLNAMAVALING